jgi:heptaprenyl diphosphate synthase
MAKLNETHSDGGSLTICPDNKALTLYPFPADLVNQRMQEVLACDSSEIQEIIAYLLESSGKMLRPRLVFLSASMYPHEPRVVTDMAVAIELVHLASLVHDDVIDQAKLRRGHVSLNSRWGNNASVLTGDYLFATAFNLVNRHNQKDILDNLSTTIQIMCAGEIKQMSLAHHLEVSEDEYLDKSYGKTACLFASCCKIGALACAMPAEEIAALEEFGLCLGYAYQIIDDLLDFLSDSSLLGKPCGGDLLEGNITLPVIYALRDPHYGPWLQTILSGDPFDPGYIPEITAALINSGAVTYSLTLSQKFLARGIARLNVLPSSPARKEIMDMGSFLLEGYYRNLSAYCPMPEQELSSS